MIGCPDLSTLCTEFPPIALRYWIKELIDEKSWKLEQEKKGKERKGKERKGKERKGKIKLPDLQKGWKGLHSYQGRQKTLWLLKEKVLPLCWEEVPLFSISLSIEDNLCTYLSLGPEGERRRKRKRRETECKNVRKEKKRKERKRPNQASWHLGISIVRNH